MVVQELPDDRGFESVTASQRDLACQGERHSAPRLTLLSCGSIRHDIPPQVLRGRSWYHLTVRSLRGRGDGLRHAGDRDPPWVDGGDRRGRSDQLSGRQRERGASGNCPHWTCRPAGLRPAGTREVLGRRDGGLPNPCIST